MNVAITHDVDRTVKTYQYFTHLIRSVKNFNISGIKNQLISIFKSRTYWNFDDIISIEDDYNIKATFFFLNETISFNPFSPSNWPLSLGRYDILNKQIIDIIQKLNDQGHEVGLHGSYNSYKDLELLRKEKKILEEIVGREIKGVRQHYLNLNQDTWRIQKLAGFKYDSSYGYSDSIGFKNNKTTIFRPFDDDFIVLPLVIMDKPFMKLGEKKWEKLNFIMEQANKNDSIFILDWHTDNFNELEYPKYRESFIKILDTLVKAGAKFYKLQQYYDEIVNRK